MLFAKTCYLILCNNRIKNLDGLQSACSFYITLYCVGDEWEVVWAWAPGAEVPVINYYNRRFLQSEQCGFVCMLYLPPLHNAPCELLFVGCNNHFWYPPSIYGLHFLNFFKPSYLLKDYTNNICGLWIWIVRLRFIRSMWKILHLYRKTLSAFPCLGDMYQ